MKRVLISLVTVMVLISALPAWSAAPGFNGEEELSAMRDKIWIVYFYRNGCNWCDKQNAALEAFRQKWGWNQIMAVNVEQEPKLAAQFQVRGVPDVWLVTTAADSPKRRRISSGFISEPSIVPYVREAYYSWFGQQ